MLLQRRRFLHVLVGLGVGGGPLFLACHREDTPSNDALEIARAMLPDRASAAAIGRRFLAEHPEEATSTVLIRELGVEPPSAATPRWRAMEMRRLREAHRRDLRDGRVVHLDGWLLSATESRLAAIVALHETGGGSDPAGEANEGLAG